MKKFINDHIRSISLLVFAMLFAVSLFAQVDSTAATTVISGLIATAEAHYKWVVPTIVILGTISEILALIPNQYIPANGVFDAILKVVRWILKAAPKA